jgi:hypothetical protein
MLTGLLAYEKWIFTGMFTLALSKDKRKKSMAESCWPEKISNS